MRPAIVFDLGGTNLRCGVADERGFIQLFQRHHIENFQQRQSAMHVWNGVMHHVVSYIESSGAAKDAPIVFSFPGPVAHRRTVLAAPTLFGPNASVPDLAAELEGATRRRVFMLNDVSAAAWYLSGCTPVRRFFVVTVSSGIGSKLFDRDHPLGVIDDPPYAGEIGHFVVDDRPDAPACDCGGLGHLGSVASGRGIERAARKRANDYPEQFAQSVCVKELRAHAASLTNEEHVIPAARIRDPWAVALIRQSSEPLARTLLAVTMATGIEKIFLIGGFAQNLGKMYLEIMTDLVCHCSHYGLLADHLSALLEVRPAGEETCLAGAAVFAQKNDREHRQ